jgi:tetratricopeptide (TPR) repeat protein
MSDNKRFQATEFLVPRNSPVVALAFYIRGKELAAAGRLDSAIAEYDAALRINPMFAPALPERGAAWAGKGNLKRALADFSIALYINPHDEMTKKNRAIAFDRQYEADTRNAEPCN